MAYIVDTREQNDAINGLVKKTENTAYMLAWWRVSLPDSPPYGRCIFSLCPPVAGLCFIHASSGGALFYTRLACEGGVV